MAKWLSKYEQGGLVLKKKTKDNYSLKGNANDATVSVGPGFVGDGTFNGPMFKNPAWKGQFAVGGSLPGSVGFMYARTQNPAPANGKYTKKTQASAQNGQEMKYYQDGLDFRPKTISQNGLSFDKSLFDLNTKAAQDATRNVIPRKMTKEEKSEAKAKADAARKRSAEKAKAIVEERMSNRRSKGDFNTPGSWHTEDKFRLFPESVGGLGEMYDDYINPGVVVGSMTDLIGESIADRNPKGVALGLGLSAGLGALGFDPLGTALKYKNVGSNYLRGLQARGHQVQGAQMFGGLDRETMDNMLSDLRNSGRIRQQPIQYHEPIPYQPPTDAELLAMNQSEATRYAPRANRPGRQRLATPEDMDALANEGPSTAEQFDWSTNRSSVMDRDRDIANAFEPTFSNRDRAGDNLLQRIRDRISARRFETMPAPQLQPQPMSESLQRALRDIDMEPSARDLDNIISSAPAPAQVVEEQVAQRAPAWGEKDFKFGNTKHEAQNTHVDPEGNTFSQNVRVHPEAGVSTGDYVIKSPEGGFMKVNTRMPLNEEDPYLKVTDLTFRNEDDAIAAKHFSKIMAHLPPKVEMSRISTSMYSQPLMNQQVARWANNNPGRIELENLENNVLNNWKKEDFAAIHDKRTGEKVGNYLTQFKRQFPKLQKTTKSLSEAYGRPLPAPSFQVPIPREDGGYLWKTFNDLRGLDDPAVKEAFLKDPRIGDYIQIKAPTYTLIKNWKHGGSIVDPMGQWAHPGKVTTIPSNNITMKGVNYDVLGVSNTGDKKLMESGKNYTFDGDYVTEYPRGGWLEKYK